MCRCLEGKGMDFLLKFENKYANWREEAQDAYISASLGSIAQERGENS